MGSLTNNINEISGLAGPYFICYCSPQTFLPFFPPLLEAHCLPNKNKNKKSPINYNLFRAKLSRDHFFTFIDINFKWNYF